MVPLTSQRCQRKTHLVVFCEVNAACACPSDWFVKLKQPETCFNLLHNDIEQSQTFHLHWHITNEVWRFLRAGNAGRKWLLIFITFTKRHPLFYSGTRHYKSTWYWWYLRKLISLLVQAESQLYNQCIIYFTLFGAGHICTHCTNKL